MFWVSASRQWNKWPGAHGDWKRHNTLLIYFLWLHSDLSTVKADLLYPKSNNTPHSQLILYYIDSPIIPGYCFAFVYTSGKNLDGNSMDSNPSVRSCEREIDGEGRVKCICMEWWGSSWKILMIYQDTQVFQWVKLHQFQLAVYILLKPWYDWSIMTNLLLSISMSLLTCD